MKNDCVRRTGKTLMMIIDDPNNNCNGIETMYIKLFLFRKSTDLPRRVQVIIVTQNCQ